MASSVDDDVSVAVSEQRRELMKAAALDSDMDLAFHLQLQEALAASLALQPPSSAPQNVAVPVIPNTPTLVTLQSVELVRLEQELKDREQSGIEMPKTREDLNRRIHDDQVVTEMMKIPDDEREETGDVFAKPFGEGSSSSSAKKVESQSESESKSVFRLYFKGLVSEEMVGNERVVLAGIGVALCDRRDNLVFEVQKPLIGNGMSKNCAQLKALIEGLNAALALDMKRITFSCENLHIFHFVTGKWSAKQRKIATLVNQVKSLQGNFIICKPRLVPRNDIKFAFKLARDAIVSQSQSQTNQPAQSTTCKNVNENCVICFEDTDVSQMFSVDGCLHRYCFTCMKQHVEVKLLHGVIPTCPHEGCKCDLSVDSCAKFLMPKHVETMRQRIKEASIPATEKVYCPYPRCSVLMSKCEILEHTKETLRDVELSGVRRCMKCHFLFCINCKVPWHGNKTCSDYKKLNPHPPEEDMKLKSLASKNLWRQCVRCNHMIELSEGCYHITCRCGYQFCYNCGAEWKDKKATCSCPLWDEGNILQEEDEDLDEEVSDSESESEYYESDSDLDDYLLNRGAEWNLKKGDFGHQLSSSDEDEIFLEDDILSNEDIDFEEEEEEEEDKYEGEDEEEVVEEGEYEDEVEEDEDEFLEESHILPAEDDGDFDEEFDEVQEIEVGEDFAEEEEEVVVQEDEHNLSGEDGGAFDEQYGEDGGAFDDQYGKDEYCGYDCDCSDSSSDYYL